MVPHENFTFNEQSTPDFLSRNVFALGNSKSDVGSQNSFLGKRLTNFVSPDLNIYHQYCHDEP